LDSANEIHISSKKKAILLLCVAYYLLLGFFIGNERLIGLEAHRTVIVDFLELSICMAGLLISFGLMTHISRKSRRKLESSLGVLGISSGILLVLYFMIRVNVGIGWHWALPGAAQLIYFFHFPELET
jgi:hypothetical protein